MGAHRARYGTPRDDQGVGAPGRLVKVPGRDDPGVVLEHGGPGKLYQAARPINLHTVDVYFESTGEILRFASKVLISAEE